MKTIKNIFGILLLLFTSLNLSAQDIPQQPTPPRLVNDLASILSPDQTQQLEYQLKKFNDSTSNQIAIVIVKSLNGLTANDMAQQIGSKWAVGQKKYNNGVVILIKPKSATEKGEAAIATGYGLESVLPDATCKRIVDQIMVPAFKQGDYYAGIAAGSIYVMKFATGEYKDSSFAKTKSKKAPVFILPLILIIMGFIVMRGFKNRSNHHGIGHNVPIWPFLFMGGFGGGSGNSGGGFGGDDGGGFGGFGGGDFGGGGASGSW
jgi:uncharacterized protein